MIKYLKNQEYYSELYDKGTIRECLWWEENADSDDATALKDKDPKNKAHKKELSKGVVAPIVVYVIKGERYAKKTETIREWMDRDQAKDDQIANAAAPKGVRCLGCSSSVKEESRNFMTTEYDQEEVVFMFSCTQCNRRRAYWENGQEWEPRPNPCPKCQTHMTRSHGRKEEIVTTTYTCPNCEYSETDTMDLSVTETVEPEIDLNFEANRKKYCLSEKEGMEYISTRSQMQQFSEMIKEREENKDVYDVLAKIKRFNIAELQNTLQSLAEEDGYINLELSKPEIQRDIIVGFTIQDSKADRSEYDSRMGLKKIIEKGLEFTNWRLMSEGITYRLGILTGRLRGYENDEDLKKIIRKSVHKK